MTMWELGVNFTSVAPAPKNARAAQYALEGIGL